MSNTLTPVHETTITGHHFKATGNNTVALKAPDLPEVTLRTSHDAAHHIAGAPDYLDERRASRTSTLTFSLAGLILLPLIAGFILTLVLGEVAPDSALGSFYHDTLAQWEMSIGAIFAGLAGTFTVFLVCVGIARLTDRIYRRHSQAITDDLLDYLHQEGEATVIGNTIVITNRQATTISIHHHSGIHRWAVPKKAVLQLNQALDTWRGHRRTQAVDTVKNQLPGVLGATLIFWLCLGVLSAVVYLQASTEADYTLPLVCGGASATMAVLTLAILGMGRYRLTGYDTDTLITSVNSLEDSVRLNHPNTEINELIAVRLSAADFPLLTPDRMLNTPQDTHRAMAQLYKKYTTPPPKPTAGHGLPATTGLLGSLAGRLFGRETPEAAAARVREEEAAKTQRELELERLRLQHADQRAEAWAQRRRDQLRDAQREWQRIQELHREVEQKFLNSQTQWETVIERPAMTDVTVETTAAMVEAYTQLRHTDDTRPDWLEHGATADAETGAPVVLDVTEELYHRRVTAFTRAYAAADSYARRVSTSLVPATERKTLNTIAKLIERASHPRTPQAERQTSYARAMALLGELRHVHVPEQAMTALQERARLEITD